MPARKNAGQATPGSKPIERVGPRDFLDPVHAPRIVPRRGPPTAILYGDSDEKMIMVPSATLPGHRVPLHSPPRERIGMVYSGRAKLWIEEEERGVKEGDFSCIPANVLHGDRRLGREPFVRLDIFSPVRDDFLRILATSATNVPVGPSAGRSDRVTRQSSLSMVAMSLPRVARATLTCSP